MTTLLVTFFAGILDIITMSVTSTQFFMSNLKEMTAYMINKILNSCSNCKQNIWKSLKTVKATVSHDVAQKYVICF